MTKKQFVIILIVAMVFAFLGGVLSNSIFPGSAVMAQVEQQTTTGQSPVPGIRDYLLKQGLFIGVVGQGKFKLLAPQPSSPLAAEIRLTGMQMQEARPPESAELNLEAYEGKAVMVHGHDGGGWIYGAAVVDSGGPLVTALVKQIFQSD